MVTPEAPVKVVKKAASTVATASPPGIHPNSALKRRTSRCEPGPPRAGTRKANSGMVGRAGEATSR